MKLAIDDVALPLGPGLNHFAPLPSPSRGHDPVERAGTLQRRIPLDEQRVCWSMVVLQDVLTVRVLIDETRRLGVHVILAVLVFMGQGERRIVGNSEHSNRGGIVGY